MATHFDFVKSVSYTKNDLMEEGLEEKEYKPFLVNKSLSYHQDSIHFANEMNIRHGSQNRLQYLFFLNTLRKRQRFSQWSKPYVSKKLEVIKEYYQISTKQAKDYISIFSDSDVRKMKKGMKTGGKDNV